MFFFKKEKMETLEATKAFEIFEKKDTNYVFVDVRDPNEWATGIIPGSIKISLSTLSDSLNQLDKSKNVIVLCQSGGRSSRGCDLLQKEGFKVFNLEGGIISWKRMNYPIEK